MAEYRYRCTQVVTTDFGDGPASAGFATAHLAVIPDGSSWRAHPVSINIDVPLGTRPGGLYRVVIDPLVEAEG